MQPTGFTVAASCQCGVMVSKMSLRAAVDILNCRFFYVVQQGSVNPRSVRCHVGSGRCDSSQAMSQIILVKSLLSSHIAL